MKKIVVACISLFYFANLVKADTINGILFRHITFQEALSLAKKENKMVFLHGFADWCGHCKTMAETVYLDSALGVFYNANFVCIKLDMEKEGKELARSYRITKYPGLLFLDASGNIVHRTTGEQKIPEMLQLGKDAMNPEKQYRTFEKKFNDGTATTDQIRTYFIMRERAGISSQKELSDYFSKVPVEDLTKNDNWRLIWDVLLDPLQPVMKTFIANKPAFEKKFTADSVNMKMMAIYNSSMMKATQQLDSVKFALLKKNLLNSGLDINQKILAYVELNVLRLKGNYTEYAKAAPSFIEKYCMDDARKLSEVAKEVCDRSYDTLLLANAEVWAKQSVVLLDIYKHNYNLAFIQQKMGKKAEAKKVAEHALELGQKSGVDFKPTLLLIEKIDELP